MQISLARVCVCVCVMTDWSLRRWISPHFSRLVFDARILTAHMILNGLIGSKQILSLQKCWPLPGRTSFTN